jgi:altronate dehydratase
MLIKTTVTTAPREEARVGMVKEKVGEAWQEKTYAQKVAEMSFEEQVREEIKLMALRSHPLIGGLIPKPINETVEMAAKALGPAQLPSEEEVAAKIQERILSRMNSMKRKN